MEPVRLGFVGCGSHAYRSHALIAARLPELFSIVALQDINDAAIDRFASLAPKARRVNHYEELVREPEVEAVIVGTPDEFHLEQTAASIAAGKHVLCEKPLWVGRETSEREGVALLARAQNEELILTSCHPRRFEPVYLSYRARLPKLVEKFGRVLEFSYRFFYEKPTTSWKQNRSLLLDHLNHEVDLANFILGHSPTRLIRHFNDFDRYAVTGHRKDGVAITFSGHRKLTEYVFWNELDIILERKRFTSCSILTQRGEVRPLSLEWVMEAKDPRVISELSAPHAYSDCFFGIMTNFALAIRGRDTNYLSIKDLSINTRAGNALVERGLYEE